MPEDLPAPTPTAEWHVRYEGVCSRCGSALHVGDAAVYERPTRSIRCVICPVDASPSMAEADFQPGVAGGSARREFERRKTQREVRIRNRFGRRLGGVVLTLTDDPQPTRAWATGARGEEKLAKALGGIDGVRVLHDRHAPGTRANIDHIAIAPAGVFVIDAKNYQGKIEIRNRGWFLRPDYRLYVGRRDCSALATGLAWQVETVTSALTAGGVEPLPPVTPVLCFVDGEWPLFSAPDVYAGVRLEGTKSIRKLLAATDALDRPSIERVARLLASALPAARV